MKTYIYYHICQLGNWREVVEDQIQFILNSGLYDAVEEILVGILGTESIELPSKYKRVYVSGNISEAELPTLNKLYEHAKLEEFNVLYIHTMGVSWESQGKNQHALREWRKYMEYFCIGKWTECIANLDDHDAVGVQWFTKCDAYNGHFSGNFWWSIV